MVVLALGALLLWSLVVNPNFQWDVVGDYLFSGAILKGLLRTIELTILAFSLGTVLGIVLSIMRRSESSVVSMAAQGYVWLFRGTPLLVQILFWFNLAALYKHLALGLPGGPSLVSVETNALITPFTAAMLGLGLHSASYMSEIIRGGLLAVPIGQTEAAQSLGMTRLETLRFVLLPQAFRVITPPAVKELISMLKYSSLVSVIAMPELLYTAQLIYSQTFQTIPLLIVASIWYLTVVTILTGFQHYLEQRHFPGRARRNNGTNRSHVPAPGPLGESQ